MAYLYIDESGSMKNNPSCDFNRYFVVAVVYTQDNKKLRNAHKRFVTSRKAKLEDCANKKGRNKMFIDGKFRELKGSEFSPELKSDFVRYFCRPRLLKVFYVVIDNTKVSRLYDNTARAFNYCLRLMLEKQIKDGAIPNEDLIIHSDERNESTKTRYFLEEYLNTELRYGGVLNGTVKVEYYDSENNKNIQIADVFANLKYSHLLSGNYEKELKLLFDSGCLSSDFIFPLG